MSSFCLELVALLSVPALPLFSPALFSLFCGGLLPANVRIVVSLRLCSKELKATRRERTAVQGDCEMASVLVTCVRPRIRAGICSIEADVRGFLGRHRFAPHVNPKP